MGPAHRSRFRSRPPETWSSRPRHAGRTRDAGPGAAGIVSGGGGDGDGWQPAPPGPDCATEPAVMRDPFTVLGVDEAADDAEIRRRYLALVRDFPPDRAPERFREYRAAYEALSDERKRLEMTLLGTNTIALSRLCTAALLAASPGSSRASKQAVAALLAEGIMRTVTDKRPPG